MGARIPAMANAAVARAFAAYPPMLRKRLLACGGSICIGMALTYHQKRARDWNATS
jgi:hypothetical protein